MMSNRKWKGEQSKPKIHTRSHTTVKFVATLTFQQKIQSKPKKQ